MQTNFSAQLKRSSDFGVKLVVDHQLLMNVKSVNRNLGCTLSVETALNVLELSSNFSSKFEPQTFINIFADSDDSPTSSCYFISMFDFSESTDESFRLNHFLTNSSSETPQVILKAKVSATTCVHDFFPLSLQRRKDFSLSKDIFQLR